MGAKLQEEFHYYVEHQRELVQKYNKKWIVIKGNKVLGAYASQKRAIQETLRKHELGTFLVKQCLPGKKHYTQMYYSRVAF